VKAARVTKRVKASEKRVEFILETSSYHRVCTIEEAAAKNDQKRGTKRWHHCARIRTNSFLFFPPLGGLSATSALVERRYRDCMLLILAMEHSGLLGTVTWFRVLGLLTILVSSLLRLESTFGCRNQKTINLR
jgi:hypothetical protein